MMAMIADNGTTKTLHTFVFKANKTVVSTPAENCHEFLFFKAKKAYLHCLQLLLCYPYSKMQGAP